MGAGAPTASDRGCPPHFSLGSMALETDRLPQPPPGPEPRPTALALGSKPLSPVCEWGRDTESVTTGRALRPMTSLAPLSGSAARAQEAEGLCVLWPLAGPAEGGRGQRQGYGTRGLWGGLFHWWRWSPRLPPQEAAGQGPPARRVALAGLAGAAGTGGVRAAGWTGCSRRPGGALGVGGGALRHRGAAGALAGRGHPRWSRPLTH